MKITNLLLKKLDRKIKIVYTKRGMSKFMGMSHQLFYMRLRDHKWDKINRLALKELFVVKEKGEDVSGQILDWLVSQKKKRKEIKLTRHQAAEKIGISIVTLYARIKNHNWKPEEIERIKKL